MIPSPTQHQELAAQIAIATLDTVKFDGAAQQMQTSADAWAVRSWNLAAIFFLARPEGRAEANPIEQELEQVQTKKRRKA